MDLLDSPIYKMYTYYLYYYKLQFLINLPIFLKDIGIFSVYA